MKLISWNIDSLNAALTSDSARAKLSQEVLQTLVAEDADIIAIQETKLSAKGPTKKHLEILEELFPGYENTWRSSQEPARKGYAGTMFLYKKELTPTIDGGSTVAYVSATTTADWLTVTPGTTKVGFTGTTNDSGAARSAKATVTVSAKNGVSASKEITITQLNA